VAQLIVTVDFGQKGLLWKQQFESKTGLPDGIFSYQKSQFGYMLEGLEMENVGIFYGHLKYVTSTGRFFVRLKIFGRHLIYFPPFWYIAPRKIWQT
jgi:hypothetical protein